jgi:hypothetical protein
MLLDAYKHYAKYATQVRAFDGELWTGSCRRRGPYTGLLTAKLRTALHNSMI